MRRAVRVSAVALALVLLSCLVAAKDGAATAGASAATTTTTVTAESNTPSKLVHATGDLATHYVVGILKETDTASETGEAAPAPAPGVRVVTMTAKNGKRFECSIPNTNPNAVRELAAAVAAASTADKAASAASTPTPAAPVAPAAREPEPEPFHDIAEQVKRVLGSGCFTKSEGYWTYEICPFKTVRQYHREGSNGPISLSFSLGRHDAAQDRIRTVSAPFAQVYTEGTDKRQTIVRYRCNPDPKPDGAHLLTSVSEPTAFHYVAEIITPLACPPASTGSAAASSSSSSAAAAATSSAVAPAGTRRQTPVAHVIELLDPLTQNCLYLNTGWWLYRFCHLKSVSQLHREHRPVRDSQPPANTPQPPPQPNGASSPAPPQQQAAALELVTVAEFDLGHFDRDLSMAALEQQTSIVTGESPEDSYVRMVYGGGTPCDLGSKEARQTEVRLYCNAGGDASSGSVEGISETTSCHYTLKVKTKLLCSHPAFARLQPPVHEISCRPVSTPTNTPR